MMKKVGMVIFILLFLILFIFLGLGSSRFWWKRGTFYSLYEQLDTAALDMAVYEVLFEGRGDEKQVAALIKNFALVRKSRFKDMLDPIEGNALTEPIYGAARIAPGIVRGYWSAIPMAFEAMSAGITNEEVLQKESNRAIIDNAKKHASRYGLMYATLMVNGVHIPLFGLILVTTGIIVGVGSKKIQRCLIIAIPLLCLLGMIYLAIAQGMVTSVPTSFLVLLESTFIIWFVIGIFFGFIILIVSFMRHFFRKAKNLS
jgi:hypothetical protein